MVRRRKIISLFFGTVILVIIGLYIAYIYVNENLSIVLSLASVFTFYYIISVYPKNKVATIIIVNLKMEDIFRNCMSVLPKNANGQKSIGVFNRFNNKYITNNYIASITCAFAEK